MLEIEDARGRPSSEEEPLTLRWEKYGDKRDFGSLESAFFPPTFSAAGGWAATVAVAAQGSECAGSEGEGCINADCGIYSAVWNKSRGKPC